MKKTLLFLMTLVSIFSFAQTQKYHRVKIYANSSQMLELKSKGVCIDHGQQKLNHWFISDFSENEIQLISETGLKYEIIIKDVQSYYQLQNEKSDNKTTPFSIGCSKTLNYPTPSDFSLGSMGGFFTYQEIQSHLDNMFNKYPNLIKKKDTLEHRTVEGRNVYWLKISDNPNNDENEPEILYTAVHHAREPGSVAQMIMYMYYLLENYSTNAEVKYLVDNSEMYFIPVVNPDGYIYNETQSPTGGGMWRKNRKDNNDGSFGIDLNRNYGYSWGFDNNGSSNNTSSETYRGPSGFSEPETMNLREFCNAHNIKITLNYHTFGNLLIYPWGYDTNIYTLDSAQFTNYGKHLTTMNKYVYGTANQTVLYTANGVSDDWMYGEQNTKQKIFAFTPEAGRSDEGFWPPQNRIIDICKENIWQNLQACHLLLNYGIISDESPNYLTSKSGYLHYKLKRLGMQTPGNFTVSITPISSQIANTGTAKTYSNVTLLQEIFDSISYTLTSGIANGQQLKYILEISNGTYTTTDTITKRFGNTSIVFSSNGSNLSGFQTPTKWGATTDDYYSSPMSINDSPGGNYASDDTASMVTSGTIDLTKALSAQLVFMCKWLIETNFDYTQILASDDNGATWNPLCGKYTKPGNGFQTNGEPVYDGFKYEWVKEEIPLDNYTGKKIKLKFITVSDNGGDYDGFYFDDLKVEIINSSSQGIFSYNNNHLVSVYPNPAGNNIQISASDELTGIKIAVKVYNLLGDEMFRNQFNGNKMNIDCSDWPEGIYFIYMLPENSNTPIVKKITVTGNK